MAIQTKQTLHDAISASATGSTVEVGGLATLTIQVAGTFVASVAWQGSINGTNWVNLRATNITDGSVAATATAAGIYKVPVAGLFYFRANVTWTSGTSITVTAVLSGDMEDSMDQPVPRVSTSLTVTIANGEALSDEIDVRGYAMMDVHMPALWTAARLAIKAAPTSGGTFQVKYDGDGNLLRCNGGANVVASSTYEVPPSVAGSRFVKVWSENGAGGDTNQGAARVITVDLKA